MHLTHHELHDVWQHCIDWEKAHQDVVISIGIIVFFLVLAIVIAAVAPEQSNMGPTPYVPYVPYY